MELEGLLPCSQKPSLSSYPESDESSPPTRCHPISLRHSLIITSLPSDLFPSRFPTKILLTFHLSYACYIAYIIPDCVISRLSLRVSY
jgi:hypothetical protein